MSARPSTGPSSDAQAVPTTPARRRRVAVEVAVAGRKPRRPAAVDVSSKPEKAAKAAKAAKVMKPKKSEKVVKAEAAAKPERPPKKAPKPRAKLVRDSFTMPADDFALIAELKARALAGRRETKKSELIRAGLRALAALDEQALLAELGRLAAVKVGRPRKGH